MCCKNRSFLLKVVTNRLGEEKLQIQGASHFCSKVPFKTTLASCFHLAHSILEVQTLSLKRSSPVCWQEPQPGETWHLCRWRSGHPRGHGWAEVTAAVLGFGLHEPAVDRKGPDRRLFSYRQILNPWSIQSPQTVASFNCHQKSLLLEFLCWVLAVTEDLKYKVSRTLCVLFWWRMTERRVACWSWAVGRVGRTRAGEPGEGLSRLYRAAGFAWCLVESFV